MTVETKAAYGNSLARFAGIPISAGSSSIFVWSILGRPITFMLLEAKAFSALVILADQYKRTCSLPWPLHRVLGFADSAWQSLTRVVGFRKPADLEDRSSGAPNGVLNSNHSLEMTKQSDIQV